ncbi:MAG: glucosaminidase domain-containing protein [Chitinophagales bacterium]|nr:glucosaminidase domain-containing protein [Chitinophagales bacterium]
MRFLFLFILYFFSSPSAIAQKKMTPEEYINTYYQLAVDEMNLYKVPASITLAQGLIETESGNSLLATKANNHFGIKCKAEWTGPTFIKDDDTKNECFRAYKSAEESFRDHSIFLLKPRYSTLFSFDMTDYRSWAYGLKQAGYATNPNYPAMLIKFIEDFKLFKFDNYGLEKPAAALPKANEKVKPQISTAELIKLRKELANNLDLIIVDETFDIYKVAANSKLSVVQLIEYNDLEGEQAIRLGQNFFLQKKGKMNLKDKHLVLLGESLYDISQIYGVSLKLLRKYNKLETWEQPNVGEVIYLSKLRDDFIQTRPFYQVSKERLEKNLSLFIPITIPEEKPIIKIDTPVSKSTEEIVSKMVPDLPKSTPEIIKVDTSIAAIQVSANKIVDTIPTKTITSIPTETLSTTQNKAWINHQVKPKETIFRISKIYDCTVSDILNWNAITIEQGLKIGQILRIHTLHPNGIVIDVPNSNEDMNMDSKVAGKPKMPPPKVSPQKITDTLKVKSVPKTIPATRENLNAKPAVVPKTSIPAIVDSKSANENNAKTEGNNVPIKTESPSAIAPKQIPISNSSTVEEIKEIPKQIPREPQKPRVVILKAPPANNASTKVPATNLDKSNMSDLYKSLMKNTEADTSIKRRIKVSE